MKMSKINRGDVCLIVGPSAGVKNIGRTCVVYKLLNEQMAFVKGDRLYNTDIMGLVTVKQKHLVVIGGTVPLFSY